MDKQNDMAQLRYIYRTKRPNSMSQKAGSEYEEVIITNYDPEQCAAQLNMFRMVCGAHDGEDIPYELIHTPEKN